MIKIKSLVVAGVLLLTSSTMVFADGLALLKYEKGDTHEDVLRIQSALRMDGVLDLDESTDYFGAQTLEAVKAFQAKYNLDTDGVVGGKTIEKLMDLGYLGHLTQPVYKLGTRHEEVKLLQRIMILEGVLELEEVTDFYGEKSAGAVKAFQDKYQLTADGVAGETTMAKIEELGYILHSDRQAKGPLGFVGQKTLKPGMEHDEVVTLQKALMRLGYFTEETSLFYGEKTKAAVALFQQDQGLDADGVAGQKTLMAMANQELIAMAPPVTRSAGRRFGEYIYWSDMETLIDKLETVFVIEDFRTGVTWNMQASYGGVHSDVEPMTKNDAAIMKSVWGGEWSWIRRPVLVHHQGRVFAASLNGMPHAGLENQPEGKTVSNRSAGFGTGYNFDDVKGNTVDGHFCLHFRGSKLHANRKVDEKHQVMVRVAAGLETE